MHFVSVDYVAALLEIDVEDAQALGDEIGVRSDTEWTDDAIDEARELLEDEDSEDSDSDGDDDDLDEELEDDELDDEEEPDDDDQEVDEEYDDE